MEIELQTGRKLNLEVSPLFFEYIEDYKGGIEQLLNDANGNLDQNGYTRTMYAQNQLLYAIIASNYDTQLTYRQAVKLVKIEDIEKIIDFINDRLSNVNTKNGSKENAHRM